MNPTLPLTRDALAAAMADGFAPKWCLFWGHTPARDGSITKTCFSQWWSGHPFTVDGVSYATAEHWMMAEKARLFSDEEVCAKILAAVHPNDAKRLGREVRGFDETRWNAARWDIVVRGNAAKFSQYPELREFLLNTGDRVLVEASPYDQIWGIGMAATDPNAEQPTRWRGLNLLGFALMAVREQLTHWKFSFPISMKRSARQSLARHTISIVQEGRYQAPSGRTVSLRAEIDAAKKGTRLYTAADLSGGAVAPAGAPTAALQVTNESTFAAMQRLHNTGAQNIGCLNFASAKNPGGGFLNGAEAQEEAISRASALYDCLLCAPGYYEQNRVGESCLYLDLIIASPGVPFFRNDDGILLENPFPATVITAPAPNAGAVTQNEPDRIPEIEPTLRRRAEMVLHAAMLQGIQNLVLGAWGCGVFRNDPRSVARAFADLLKRDHTWSGCFEQIVFAVFDPAAVGPNYTAFREEMLP